MTGAEKQALTERAAEALRNWERPIVIETDINHAVALIGITQLALRHPGLAGSGSAQMTEGLVRQLIEAIDPAHGDVFQFLCMGFDPAHDE